jgi:hypothetical protein
MGVWSLPWPGSPTTSHGRREAFCRLVQLLGNSVLAILRGRQGKFIVKAFGEVGQVVKAAVKGDVCNALV